MPVFKVMQPHVHAQQFGGGGYGGQYPQPLLGGAPQMPGAVGPAGVTGAGGATNPAPGGTPYAPGMGAVGADGQTAADPFNPLSNPQAAIARALLAKGLNPATPNWGISKLLERADDIVRQLAGRLALGKNEDVLTGGGFQDSLNALIGSGRNVISGRAEGQAAMDAIQSLVSTGYQENTGSEGAQFLRAILGPDVKSASAFLDSLVYGGLAPNVRGALTRELRMAPTRWDIMAGTEGGYDQIERQSALDILLSGMLGRGTQGPFGTTAAQYPGGPAPGPTPGPGQFGMR